MLSEIAQGKNNTAIAESLFLTKRAVEKHINAIFLKLGLADAQDVSKRVKATLMLLAETGLTPPVAPAPHDGGMRALLGEVNLPLEAPENTSRRSVSCSQPTTRSSTSSGRC